MEPFIYFIKYFISIKLEFGLIAICSNEACVFSKYIWAGFVRYTFRKIIGMY